MRAPPDHGSTDANRCLSVHLTSPSTEQEGYLSRGQRMTDWVLREGMAQPQDRNLRLGPLVRAMYGGARTDLERRALSEGSDAAGGYMVPTMLSARLIDGLRARSVVFRAGAQTLPFDTKTYNIAKIASDPTPEWLAEAAASTFSDPTLSRVQLSAKTARVLFKASRELVMDAPNFDAMLERTIAGAFSVAVDTAALVGSSSSNTPTGILASSDITVDAVNAGLEIVGASTVWSKFTNYDPIVAATKLILADNAPKPNAAVLHSVDYCRLLGRGKDSQLQPLQPPPLLEDVDVMFSNVLPSTGAVTYGAVEGSSADATQAVVGYFPDLVVGMRSGVMILPLRERYVETNEIGFFAMMRLDIATQHSQSFAAIDHLSETATT